MNAPVGSSPAYAMGWNDATAGEPLPSGISSAYAEGYTDAASAQSAAQGFATGSTHPDCAGDTDLCPDSGCKRCQGQMYDNGVRGRIR